MILASILIALLFVALANNKSGFASGVAVLAAAGFFAFSLYAHHAGL